MKNLVWAIGILIVVVVGVFAFTSRQANRDTTLPSPISVTTPTPDLSSLDINKTEDSNKKMQLPFPLLSKEQIEGKKIRITTSKGDIVFELYADSPIAASNMIYLVNKKFYDHLKFHRREEGFVIQGGDPDGNGTGGPGYAFGDEPVLHNYDRGIVAMANAGPNTNGSQFFIMLADNTSLPKQYSIFGKVTEGLEVVDKIVVGDVMNKVTIE